MPLQSVKRMQNSKPGMWKGYHSSMEGIRKEYPFLQNKGKGLDLGRSLPVLKLFRAPSGQKASQGLDKPPGLRSNPIELFRERGSERENLSTEREGRGRKPSLSPSPFISLFALVPNFSSRKTSAETLTTQARTGFDKGNRKNNLPRFSLVRPFYFLLLPDADASWTTL